MEPQDRYTILREIASGGTATVFLAEDCVLRRKVALKKLHPHLLNRPDMVRRFQKEAVAVASLSHENVIKIFDYGHEGKSVFLAMEFIDGVSLEALLESARGLIPNLAALSLFQQLLDGLAAAHARGICHRDIKPSNVLLDRKGRVSLADFGIAYLSEETSHTRTGAYLGTPGFSAPEQAEGKEVTEKTDIFSAGILLYRCLTGKMPFTAGSTHAVLKAIVEKTQARANMLNPRLLPGLADMAGEMLSKHPEQRPSAKACVLRLDSIATAAGFAISAARLRALVDDPSVTAETEAREIGERYLAMARTQEGSGKGREALRMYSLVQVFADKGSETAKEAQRHLRTGARRVRVLSIAGTALACGLAALWPIFGPRHAPKPPAARPTSAAVPAAPAQASVPSASQSSASEWHRDLALPVDVPAWERSSVGNRPVTSGGTHARSSARTAAMVPASYSSSSASPSDADRRAPAAVAPEPAVAPAAGYLWIKTTPPFARLRIDGQESGATPMDAPLSLTEGTHRLEVEHEGCQAMAQEVRVAVGDTVMLRLSLQRMEEHVVQHAEQHVEAGP
jgi:tRNA A-37 threonylcarbamoyl transferase component Bud32